MWATPLFYRNKAHEGDKLTTWPLHHTVKGKIFIVDMNEIYQRLLEESRTERESSRLDIGSRLGLARRETGAERRQKQRPRERTVKTAGLEGEGEVGEGKPVSWDSLGVRGDKSQEASVGSKRSDAVGAWRPACYQSPLQPFVPSASDDGNEAFGRGEPFS